MTSISNHLEKYLVPAILIIVASFQIYNSQYRNLDPWKGAGFGMFSTNTTNEVNAIGYLPNGDSILIAVQGNRFDTPISKSIVKTANRFPQDVILKKIGKLLLTVHFRPDTLKINNLPGNDLLLDKIQKDKLFFTRIYTPRFYQEKRYIDIEHAVRIERVKIVLSKCYFENNGYTFKKKIIKEIVV